MPDPTVPIAGVCGSCGAGVRNREPYTWVEVIGWRRLTRTGAPSAVMKEVKSTGRILCAACVPDESMGSGETLFDV